MVRGDFDLTEFDLYPQDLADYLFSRKDIDYESQFLNDYLGSDFHNDSIELADLTEGLSEKAKKTIFKMANILLTQSETNK